MRVPLSKDRLDSIFSIHSSIRYVTILNKEGVLLDSVKRAGIDSLEPPEATEMIVRRWVVARGMTSGTDEFFGSVKTIIIKREKLVELFFPLPDQNLIITANPGFPLDKVPKLETVLSKLQAEA